ncbi:hypothetical protein AA313_de0206230 [Arthrobotrys entomopaga]|nr:hypothetical protein AA313_de0206230 [Arthrobotrys entomopaga]
MSAPERPTVIKVLLIGPSSSGKTSLLKRYVDDVFEPDDTTTTIGVDFREKKMTINKKLYRLLLHDTAGQEYAIFISPSPSPSYLGLIT